MKNYTTILLVLLTLTFSCSKDDDKSPTPVQQFDGSEEAIENFFSAEVLDAMDELGFPVNEGTAPPIINGEYLISPLEAIASNIDGDLIGKIYSDANVTFSNQSNETMTVDVVEIQGGSNSVAEQSFISGSANSFSVFVKLANTGNGHTRILAVAYSGFLSESGIQNFQSVLIMLDDKGDPNNDLIENGQGRLFKDSDEISPKQ